MNESKSSVIGSSVIYWCMSQDGPYLLLGKESKYLDENIIYCKLLTDLNICVEKMQEFVGGGREESYQHFANCARKLTLLLKREIRFDEPHRDKAGVVWRWRVHYRYIVDNAYQGIIKGSKQGNESPIQTAIRESKEELFAFSSSSYLPFSENRFTHLGEVASGYAVFHCQLSTLEMIELLNEVDKMESKKYGELFDIQFVSLSTISNQLKPGFYNKKSCEAIRLLVG